MGKSRGMYGKYICYGKYIYYGIVSLVGVRI